MWRRGSVVLIFFHSLLLLIFLLEKRTLELLGDGESIRVLFHDKTTQTTLADNRFQEMVSVPRSGFRLCSKRLERRELNKEKNFVQSPFSQETNVR